MAQFLVLESVNSDGKPTELCVNIDQICRVFVLGSADAVESMEVHMADGQRLVLEDEAAAALLNVISNSQNMVQLDKTPKP